VLATYATPENPWLSLWARWTAIRAGCWDIANTLTPAERTLLPRSMQLEIASFGHYYAGQHARGAILQRDAALYTINEGAPLDRYLYHRNNEAEFYNRGGFTQQAMSTVIDAGWNYFRRRKHASDMRMLALKREFRNLLSCLTLLWPLPAI